MLFYLLLGLLCAEVMAQTRTGSETNRAQDTLSTEREVLLIELLDESFHSLAEEDRRSRRIGGYVMLGLGIGSGVGGGATLLFGEGDDAQIVGLALLGGGALLSGLSLLPLKLKSETERIYTEFGRIPADTPDQIHQKYVYWNRRFEELAQKRRKERITGGISSIVIGGVTGVVVANSSDANTQQALIWSTLGPVIGGVVNLLTKSDEERRYETYLRVKGDITGHTSKTKILFGYAPIPGGGMHSVVQVRF